MNPYFKYEQRRNTKVNIQSAIYHSLPNATNNTIYDYYARRYIRGTKQSQLEGNSRIQMENTFEYHLPTPTNHIIMLRLILTEHRSPL